MRCLGDAELFQPFVIEAPADIIVASQIVQEDIILRQSRHNIHLMFQQAGIRRCNGVPGGCHRRYVVQHMALRFFQSSEVRNNLFRLHDNLAEQQNARADDLGDHTHHADNGMYLRQVTAGGAELFPDVWNGIDADDIDSLVDEIEHVVDHLIEDNRVRIVQIPLVRVECCHDKFVTVLSPGKVARCRCREYLRTGLFIFGRNIVVVEEKVTVLVLFLTGKCTFCPFMILGSVVHNEIHTKAHALVMAFFREGSQIFHRSKGRLYRAVIGNRIAAVAFSLRRCKERHQMQVVDVALF